MTIVFRDNLHQPQYVEKLDKLVRFCIKEKVLSLQDLNRIWAAQDGKHEIIVKNIHDLLVKLAWDFSPEQLDHLFGCFQVWPICCTVRPCTCTYTLIHCVQCASVFRILPHSKLCLLYCIIFAYHYVVKVV